MHVINTKPHLGGPNALSVCQLSNKHSLPAKCIRLCQLEETVSFMCFRPICTNLDINVKMQHKLSSSYLIKRDSDPMKRMICASCADRYHANGFLSACNVCAP